MSVYNSRFSDLTFKDQTITQRVFEGLQGRGDAVVLSDGITGRTVSAQALMDEIRSFAGGLNERGMGAGHTIALMAPNCPQYCTVFHGAAWAGATITTINPSYTQSEVHHQLNDAGAEMLITVPQTYETAKAAIRGTDVSQIVVIGDLDGVASLADLMGKPMAEQTPVDLDNHVLVLPYSSGTTGLPKGVMLTHRNMVANIDQILSIGNIQAGETTPAFLPFFHIYGLTIGLNAYLAARAHLVTMPRFDLEMFLQLAQDHKARALWVVPPVAIALAKHPLVDQFDLSLLEIVSSAAAPLGAELGNAVADRLNCVALQAYGLTELSPASHVLPLRDARPGSVGLSLPNTACRIVDTKTGADLGHGQEGELWVRGPQVMKGYLNNATATAEAIDPDGWLRTGDIGYFDAEGFLFIVDRLKELIKYKGFQIAPAELEAALLGMTGIADVAVVGVADAKAGEVPKAFVVPAPDTVLTLEQVQTYLSGRVAKYKQVQHVEFVDAIPKSASGKILRRLLRASMAG